MVYHGRIVVAGPGFVAYAISGRSPPSQKRRLEFREDMIYAGPVGEPTEEQKRNAGLIFYNAMRARDDRTIIVTNGAHTDAKQKDGIAVPNFFDDFSLEEAESSAGRIMSAWGYEPDSAKTPRIALVKNVGMMAFFSIATESSGQTATGTCREQFHEYAPRGLATYSGRNDEADSWHISSSENIQGLLINVPISGNTPDELASSLYNFVDQRYIVAAAAAVYDGKWVMKVKNRFETEEDFARHEETMKK